MVAFALLREEEEILHLDLQRLSQFDERSYRRATNTSQDFRDVPLTQTAFEVEAIQRTILLQDELFETLAKQGGSVHPGDTSQNLLDHMFVIPYSHEP